MEMAPYLTMQFHILDLLPLRSDPIILFKSNNLLLTKNLIPHFIITQMFCKTNNFKVINYPSLFFE